MTTGRIFHKKIFTAEIMIKDRRFLLLKFLKIIGAFRNKKMNSAFIEKIMTITAAVNGCVSCTWFNAKEAAHSGINEEEVKNMLNLQLQSDAAEFETMALLYA